MNPREFDQLVLSLRHLQNSIISADPSDKQRAINMSLLTWPVIERNKAELQFVKVGRLSECQGNKTTILYSDSIAPTTEFFSRSQSIESENDILSFYKFPNATVTKDNYVIADGVLYIDDIQFTFPDWQQGGEHPLFYQNERLSSYCPSDGTAYIARPPIEVDEEIFVFNIRNAGVNFGHFILDFLVQLLIFRCAASENQNLKCYIPTVFKYEVQEYIINHLFSSFIASNKVVRTPRPGKYKNIVVPALQFPPLGNNIQTKSVKYCRDVLSALASETALRIKTSQPERIFVSRKDWTSNAYNRNESDEFELQQFFAQFGFVTVVNSDLSPQEQLVKYSKAKIVAGMHGAGLLNVLFSGQQDVMLIEIDARIHTWRAIERFIRGAGLNHILIEPDRSGDVLSYKDALDDLKKMLAFT